MPRHILSRRNPPGRFHPAVAGIQALQANRTFSPASIRNMFDNLVNPGSAAYQPELAREGRLANDLTQEQIFNLRKNRSLADPTLQLEQDKLAQGDTANTINKMRAMADIIRAKNSGKGEDPATEQLLRSVMGDELYEATKDDRLSFGQGVTLRKLKQTGRGLDLEQDRLNFSSSRNVDIRGEQEQKHGLNIRAENRKLSDFMVRVDDILRGQKIDPQTIKTIKQLMGRAQSFGGRAEGGRSQAQPSRIPVETAPQEQALPDAFPGSFLSRPPFLQSPAPAPVSAPGPAPVQAPTPSPPQNPSLPTPQEKVEIEGEAMQLIEADPQYDDASELEKRRAARPIADEIFKARR